MKEMKRVAVFFYRIGPYHLARLKAAAAFFDLTGVEYTTEDSVYAWERTSGSEGYQRLVLFPGESIEAKNTFTITNRVNAVLNQIRPDVVALPGWVGTSVIAAINWCRQSKIPLVVMSESTSWDFKRIWIKELSKRWLLSHFSAALVGGIPHRDYLLQLGFSPDQIFTGYDAVDNAYFAGKSYDASSGSTTLENPAPAWNGLEKRFFLASSRFVIKKNLSSLLIAYSEYRKLTQKEEPWKLVILGDGPLRVTLAELAISLGIGGHVTFPGFIQYPQLPGYYASAGVFVHPSTTEQWGLVVNEAMASGLPVLVSNRCGCAFDLVKNGQNGYTFDPYDTKALAELMHHMSAPEFPLTEYGASSRKIVSHYDVDAFAQGLERAVNFALGNKRTEALFTIPLLPPIGSLMSDKPDNDDPHKNLRCLLFSFAGKPVIAFPEKPKALRCKASLVLKSPTRRRWLFRSTFQICQKLSLLDLTARKIDSASYHELNFSYHNWSRMLGNKLGCNMVYLIATWPVQPERRRLYIHVFDETLQQKAFAKISFLRSDAKLLIKESVSIGSIRFGSASRLVIPKVLGNGEFEGAYVSLQEPMPLHANTPAWGQKHNPARMIAEWSGTIHKSSADEVRATSWWQQYVSNIPPGAEFFDATMRNLLFSGANMCFVHGDLGLSNLHSDGERIWIFDWEYSSPIAPVLTDHLGYVLSFDLTRTRVDAANFAQMIAHFFLYSGSTYTPLDVMLALAYRHSCGLPDARRYMCKWEKISAYIGQRCDLTGENI